MKNQIGDSQLTIEFLDRYKPLEIERPPLPPDEQRELEALTSLSDEALWTLAREQMAQDKQACLQVLRLLEAASQSVDNGGARISLKGAGV